MFMCAIYEITTHPEYLQPLRDEISVALESEGGTWSKNTVSKLYKMDSFFREVQRCYDMQLCMPSLFFARCSQRNDDLSSFLS
jgi:hypothetical protein